MTSPFTKEGLLLKAIFRSKANNVGDDIDDQTLEELEALHDTLKAHFDHVN